MKTFMLVDLGLVLWEKPIPTSTDSKLAQILMPKQCQDRDQTMTVAQLTCVIFKMHTYDMAPKSMYISPAVSFLYQCNSQHAHFGHHRVVISKNLKSMMQNYIYRIVASTNTCYYSENQVFGGVTIRVLCSKRGCY